MSTCALTHVNSPDESIHVHIRRRLYGRTNSESIRGIKLSAQRNETETKQFHHCFITVSKLFWNCFVSVSFRYADSFEQLLFTVER